MRMTTMIFKAKVATKRYTMVNIRCDSLGYILLYIHRVVEKYWKIYFTSPKLVHLYSCVPYEHGDLE